MSHLTRETLANNYVFSNKSLLKQLTYRETQYRCLLIQELNQLPTYISTNILKLPSIPAFITTAIGYIVIIFDTIIYV